MNTRNTYTKDHTQMINDSTQITGSNRNSPALVDLLTLVFVLQWLSLHGKILIMLLPQFLLTFIQIQSGCSFPWHSSLFSCWLGRSVMIWEILHGRIHLNCVSVATAAAEFCQSVQARTDVIFFIKNLWSTLVLLILP